TALSVLAPAKISPVPFRGRCRRGMARANSANRLPAAQRGRWESKPGQAAGASGASPSSCLPFAGNRSDRVSDPTFAAQRRLRRAISLHGLGLRSGHTLQGLGRGLFDIGVLVLGELGEGLLPAVTHLSQRPQGGKDNGGGFFFPVYRLLKV